MTQTAFDDLLATYREQRDRIEGARRLPPGGPERALAKLDEIRSSTLVDLADLTSDQRADLEAEFDRLESALRKHMEN